MKLKYYLRGLGIGIVVTALIMGLISLSKKETLSDAEVIARAEKLGMVQSGVLSEDLGGDSIENQNENQIENNDDGDSVDTLSENTQKPVDLVEPEKPVEPVENIEPEKPVEPVATVEPAEPVVDEKKEDVKPAEPVVDEKKEDVKPAEPVEPVETVKPADATEVTDNSTAADTVTIKVNGGDGSRTVAQRLKDAGVIDNVEVFDNYLCKNGYDRHITTGNHIIKKDSNYKDIAENLTKKVN